MNRGSWVVGLGTVLFDVDVGPKVEHLVPEDALTVEERQDVAFHAFPDSMSMELHARSTIRDSCFFFRVKRRGAQPAPLPATDASQASTSERFLYGFVFCRQRQDASLRRGGEQLSVLVLSEYPFSSVLRPLSQAAGHAFFSHGKAALEHLYQEILLWPPPVSGPLLQLHAGHTNIQARLPSMQMLPHPSTSLEPEHRSRTSSIDNVLSQLEGAVDAVLSEQRAALHASASVGAGLPGLRIANSVDSSVLQAAAAGQGSTPVTPSSPSQKPPLARSSLSRAGSVPSSRLAGPGYVFAKSVPANLGRRTSGDTAGARGQEGQGADAAGAAANGSGSNGAAAASAALPGAMSLPGPLAKTASNQSLSGEEGAAAAAGGGAGGGPGGSGGLPVLHTSSSFSTQQSAGGVQRRTSLGLESQNSVAGVFSEVDLFSSFQAHLPRLWQLWEMVLLGKPLIIVGLSPADCCNATAALISLVAPLPFRPDFRPYFTIHDTSFKALASGQMPSDEQPGLLPCLVGVTNPYFIKALSHWPSVLSVGHKEQSAWGTSATGASSTAALLNPGAAVKALTQRMRGAQSLLTSHSEALWSTYKPLTRPDDVLLARLLKPQAGDVRSKLARIAAVNSEALRRHFQELTVALLTPFARYFEPGSDGHVARWEAEPFLASLSSNPPPVLLAERFARQADLVELYARFVGSSNFRFWMELRQQPLQHLLAPEPLPVVAPLGKDGKPLEEVELVGMFFELEIQLQELEAGRGAADPEAKADITRLRRTLASLFFAMSEDLQWTCISSPSRRQLLASLQAELGLEQQQQLQRLVARLK